MSIASERYITVCYPFFKLSHNWPARRYIIPIIVLSLAYNLPKFFELEVVTIGGRCFQIKILLSLTKVYLKHPTVINEGCWSQACTPSPANAIVYHP